MDTPQKGKRARGDGVGFDLPLDGLFELLGAAEGGLVLLAVLLGVLTLAVAVPLLVIALGAAVAAHAHRKRSPRAPTPAVRAVLFAPAVLLPAYLLLALSGLASVAAYAAGHPVLMGLSYAAALVTLAGLGYWAMRRRAERA